MTRTHTTSHPGGGPDTDGLAASSPREARRRRGDRSKGGPTTAGSALEVPDDLVRLSVGIETTTDLVADVEQALS